MELVDAGSISYMFRSMLKEEWRLQRSFVGSFGAYFFPFFILLISIVIFSVFSVDEGSSPIIDVILVMMFLYGLGVGGIAVMGEQIMERRLGEVHLLLKTPQLQPVSFRSVVSIFFVKEVFFYHLYSSIPFALGMLIGGALTGAPIGISLMFILSVMVVFTLGMSLSFLLSSILVRSRALGILCILIIPAIIVLLSLLGICEPVGLLHPLYFWRTDDVSWLLWGIVESLLISASAVILMRPGRRRGVARVRSSTLSIPLETLGTEKRRALLVKEWLELKRSGTLFPVIFSFIGPLIAIYGLVLLFREGMGLDLPFNTVFYGALIGFFGMMTYSWLNNVETNESLNLLPVDVPYIIDIKLLMYFAITTPIALVYISIIAVTSGDMDLLPVALLVGFSTNTYVAFIVARLTGTRTNSMLLDAVTLVKFSTLVIPPLIFLVIMSFYLEDRNITALAILVTSSLVLVIASVAGWKGIRSRWSRERFGMQGSK